MYKDTTNVRYCQGDSLPHPHHLAIGNGISNLQSLIINGIPIEYHPALKETSIVFTNFTLLIISNYLWFSMQLAISFNFSAFLGSSMTTV